MRHPSIGCDTIRYKTEHVQQNVGILFGKHKALHTSDSDTISLLCAFVGFDGFYWHVCVCVCVVEIHICAIGLCSFKPEQCTRFVICECGVVVTKC